MAQVARKHSASEQSTLGVNGLTACTPTEDASLLQICVMKEVAAKSNRCTRSGTSGQYSCSYTTCRNVGRACYTREKPIMKKVLSLIGARPQIVKEALVGKAARDAGVWHHIVVHSGQHYDPALSDIFFEELAIPAPAHHLGIGSGSHATMTAAAMVGVERVLLEEKPDALLVYGDTNTTLAGALAASKLHIPVVHVEAGIRMLPKTMPEEINRVLTDHVASVFCCCSETEVASLRREGITERVVVTGDVMYDLFLHMRQRLTPEALCKKYTVTPGNFVVVTLHRDYNVDVRDKFCKILDELIFLSKHIQVLFFLHPRTQKRIEEFCFSNKLIHFRCAPPESYLSLMSLVNACAFVITDSGGLQKEAYYAKKRTVVVMPDTGWRALTECGWNVLAGRGAELSAALSTMLETYQPAYPVHLYGDGNAAHHIVRAVDDFLRHNNEQ